MSRVDNAQASRINSTDRSWRSMYLIGGVASLLALAGTLIDISLSMVPGWEASTAPTVIQIWFTQLQSDPFLGLRNLDLLNVLISLVQIPIFLAIFGAHRRVNPSFAMLALVVVLAGTVIFLSSNAALPMLDLSNQYSSSSTPDQQRVLEAAGVTLLARGAHGSMGAFAGFFLSSVGTLLMGLVMLDGRIFRRRTALVGVVGICLLIIYLGLSTFSQVSEGVLMAIAGLGGVLMLAWFVMVAIELFKLRSVGQELEVKA